MAEMTLTEAAKWSGKSRTTIFKAIKNGRISATKNDAGEWLVNPAELARVYEPAEAVNVTVNGSGEHADIAGERTINASELEMLRKINAMLESQVHDLKTERDRLMTLVETQTHLIADHTKRRPWWHWLTGKG